MMSIQAIYKYFYCFNDSRVLIVTDRKYELLYKKIFSDTEIQIDSYQNIENHEKLFECKKLIDLNSTEVSKKILEETICLDKYSFQFETTRIITQQSNDQISTANAIDICDKVGSDSSLKHPAWVMDAELICAAFKKPLIINEIKSKKTFEVNTLKNILCFPCGSNNKKHWPKENWSGLIDAFKKDGLNITVFLGTDEKKYISYFSSITSIEIDLKLEQLVDVYFNEDTLVVSNDCGPMHVAAFYGMPLVSIFGPTDEKVWFPYTHGQAIRSINNDDWPTTDEVLKVINSIRFSQNRLCQAKQGAKVASDAPPS
jgi:hypothetical protein